MSLVQGVGRATLRGIEELGHIGLLLWESLEWLLLGPFRGQPVRLSLVFEQARAVGLQAVPIVALLAFVIGMMLAIQGIETLKTFGAESQVVVGIALSVTREFAPLITGIVVAGRSGSAIAAQIGTMQISQEVDALQVIGIHPVRQLVAPVLFAMLVLLPCLTLLADLMGLLGGAVYSALELGVSIPAYFDRTVEALAADDLFQGLIKSLVFALIIALVAAANGFNVSGGLRG